MKNFFATLLLVTVIVVGFTGKSWAMGSHKHHHSGSGSGSSDSGDSFFSDNNGNNDNTDNGGLNSDFILPNDFGNNNSDDPDHHDWDRKHRRHHHDNDHDWDGNRDGGNSQDPAAPVPEPMTLSLLGTGLAGMFLRRKTS